MKLRQMNVNFMFFLKNVKFVCIKLIEGYK